MVIYTRECIPIYLGTEDPNNKNQCHHVDCTSL